MGNSLSSPTLLPLTFADCFTEGIIDIKKYQLYLLLKRKREDSLESPNNLFPPYQSNVDNGHQKKKRKRSVKKHRVQIFNADGSFMYMEPCSSLWYVLYVSREPRSNKEKIFRKRFHLSYSSFKKLLEEIKQHDSF